MATVNINLSSLIPLATRKKEEKWTIWPYFVSKRRWYISLVLVCRLIKMENLISNIYCVDTDTFTQIPSTKLPLTVDVLKFYFGNKKN